MSTDLISLGWLTYLESKDQRSAIKHTLRHKLRVSNVSFYVFVWNLFEIHSLAVERATFNTLFKYLILISCTVFSTALWLFVDFYALLTPPWSFALPPCFYLHFTSSLCRGLITRKRVELLIWRALFPPRLVYLTIERVPLFSGHFTLCICLTLLSFTN